MRPLLNGQRVYRFHTIFYCLRISSRIKQSIASENSCQIPQAAPSRFFRIPFLHHSTLLTKAFQPRIEAVQFSYIRAIFYANLQRHDFGVKSGALCRRPMSLLVIIDDCSLSWTSLYYFTPATHGIFPQDIMKIAFQLDRRIRNSLIDWMMYLKDTRARRNKNVAVLSRWTDVWCSAHWHVNKLPVTHPHPKANRISNFNFHCQKNKQREPVTVSFSRVQDSCVLFVVQGDLQGARILRFPEPVENSEKLPSVNPSIHRFRRCYCKK